MKVWPKCNVYGYEKETFFANICAELRNVIAAHEFDSIVFLPALLHLEMNAGRAFRKLNWSVFMDSDRKNFHL